MPNVNTQEELAYVMRHNGAFSDGDARRACQEIEEVTGSRDIGVGIKSILTGIKTAKQDSDQVGRFASFVVDGIAERFAS